MMKMMVMILTCRAPHTADTLQWNECRWPLPWWPDRARVRGLPVRLPLRMMMMVKSWTRLSVRDGVAKSERGEEGIKKKQRDGERVLVLDGGGGGRWRDDGESSEESSFSLSLCPDLRERGWVTLSEAQPARPLPLRQPIVGRDTHTQGCHGNCILSVLGRKSANRAKVQKLQYYCK